MAILCKARDSPEPSVLQGDPEDNPLSPVIRNALKRKPSTAKKFSGGCPLRARADRRRGGPRAGLVTCLVIWGWHLTARTRKA